MAVVEASVEHTKDGAVETQTTIPFPRRRTKLMKVPNSQSPITEQRSEGRKKSPSKNVSAHCIHGLGHGEGTELVTRAFHALGATLREGRGCVIPQEASDGASVHGVQMFPCGGRFFRVLSLV